MSHSPSYAIPRRVLEIPETRQLREHSAGIGELMSIGDASHMIGLSRATLTVYINRPGAMPFRLIRRSTQWYVLRADVFAYIEENRELVERRIRRRDEIK
jgi:hypothetical protein